MFYKKVFCLCLFLSYSFTIAQHFHVPDSLRDKSYLYFREALDNDATDSNAERIYASAYLSLAKSRTDWAELVEAYKNTLHLHTGEIRLTYCDSMIIAARKSKRNDLIGSAYLTKGIMFYGMKRHKEALDNYVIAEQFISHTGNQYLIHKLKFSLAETKYYLHYYHDAVSLLKDCVDYYQQSGGKPWLSSMHHLGLCYIKIGKYELCSAINELGLEEAIKADEEDMIVYFTHSEGVNQYYRKNYELAISKLRHAAQGLIKRNDMPNEMVAYFYIGKCYWDQKQANNALPYFLKIDNALIKHNYTRRDLREGISFLVDYYAMHDNRDLELEYSHHLRKADSILSNNFEALSNKVHARQYKENDNRIERLESDNKKKDIQVWSLRVLSAIALLIIIYSIRRNRILNQQFKKRYDDFVANGDVLKAPEIVPAKLPETLAVPKNEQKLYESLQRFETEKIYLLPNMGKTNIAKQLGTNPTYAAYVISQYRQKGIVQYINDLKCEHAMELLTNDKNFRHFDQQSQANEIGFATAQHLRRAFIKRYGFAPRFYIAQLEMENDRDELKT